MLRVMSPQHPAEQSPPVYSDRPQGRHSLPMSAGLSPAHCPRISPGSVTAQAGWAGHAMGRRLRRFQNLGRRLPCRLQRNQLGLPA